MEGELITKEQAEALSEAFKFGKVSVETVRAFGGYVSRILGSVPEDLVGLLGGDWLRIRRAENIINVGRRANERLAARGVEEPSPVSLSVAIPLLEAAADESREELVDLWARLMAAAQDPTRSNQVRRVYVEIVKQMDPLDVLVLDELKDANPGLQPSPQAHFANRFQRSADDVEESLQHLVELGLLRDGRYAVGAFVMQWTYPLLTTRARELKRILRD